MRKQSGFTLIELVIVVVILGFLAVTAIPKFIDLTDQAKQANIEGMAGGFATGVSLVRAQWEAEGRPKTAANINEIDYDGTLFILTTPPVLPALNPLNIRPGYPTGLLAANAALAAVTTDRCIEVWNGILSQPPTVSAAIADVNNSALNIQYFVDIDANNATHCVYYLVATLTKNAGVFVDPAGDTNIGNNFTYNPANSSVAINIAN